MWRDVFLFWNFFLVIFAQIYQQNQQSPQQSFPTDNQFLGLRIASGINTPYTLNRPLTMGQAARLDRYPDLRNQLKPDYVSKFMSVKILTLNI